MTLLDPGALLARYRDSGETFHLNALFDAVSPQLLRTAVRIAPPQVAAEEIVQDTLLRALDIAHRYQPDRPLLPWLRGIAVQVARESARRRRPHQAVTESLESGATPLDAAHRSETLALILGAIDSLPDEQRRLVEPYALGGRTPSQLARETGLPLGTVKSRIARGMDALRAKLPVSLAAALALLVAQPLLAGARQRFTARPASPRAGSTTAGPKPSKSLVAGLALVLALGASWSWTSGSLGTPPVVRPQGQWTTADNGSAPADSTASAAVRRAIEPSAAVAGQIMDLDGRHPSAAVLVVLATTADAPPPPPYTPIEWLELTLRSPDRALVPATTALSRSKVDPASGRFAFPRPATGRAWLDLRDDHCGFAAPVPWVDAHLGDGDLRLPVYRGVCVVGNEPALAGQDIDLSILPRSAPPDIVTATAVRRARGRYTTRVLADGSYRFRAIPCAGPLRLRASDGDRAFCADLPGPRPGTTVTAVLRRAPTTNISLELRWLGTPPPADSVELRVIDPTAQCTVRTVRVERIDQIRLAGLPPFEYGIEVHAPGWETGSVRCGAQDHHALADVCMRPTIRICGCVHDPDGQPLAGARVEFDDADRSASAPLITDREGRFETNLPAAHRSLLVRPPMDRFDLSGIAIPAGSRPDTIQLPRRPRGTVQLTTPIDDRTAVRVSWSASGDDPLEERPPRLRHVDASGQLDLGFGTLGPGTVRIETADGRCADIPWIPTGAGLLDLGTVRLTAQQKAWVELCDVSGSPIDHGFVTVVGAQAPPPVLVGIGHADRAGRWDCAPTARPLVLNARSGNLIGSCQLDGLAAGTVTRIALRPTGSIHGRAAGADHVALLGANAVDARVSPVDEQGRFCFDHVAADSYLVVAETSAGSLPQQWRWHGAASAMVELAPGGRERVELEAQEPPAETLLRVRGLGPHDDALAVCTKGGQPATAAPLINGNAKLALPDLPFHLTVLDRRGAPLLARFVESLSNPWIVHAHPETVRGQVDGAASAVFALPLGDARATDHPPPPALPDRRGAFELRDLPAGRYRVLAIGSNAATAIVDVPTNSRLDLSLHPSAQLALRSITATDVSVRPHDCTVPIYRGPLGAGKGLELSLPPGVYEITEHPKGAERSPIQVVLRPRIQSTVELGAYSGLIEGKTSYAQSSSR